MYWLCNHMLVPQTPSSFNVLVCSNKQTIWYYFLVAMNAFHPSFHDWLLSQWSIVCMGVVNCHSQVNFLWKLHHLHLTNTIIPTLLTHTEVFFDLGQSVCIKGHIIDFQFHTHSERTVCLTDRDWVLLFQPCASALVYISFLCRKEKCTSNSYRPAYTYCKMLYALAQLCQADEWWLKLIIFLALNQHK